MVQLEARLGGETFIITANEKIADLLFLAEHRINHRKHSNKDRHPHKQIGLTTIDLNANLIYALDEVLEDSGYTDFGHLLFTEFNQAERRILYYLLREDKTFKFLTFVQGYEEVLVRGTIQKFFSTLSKKI